MQRILFAKVIYFIFLFITSVKILSTSLKYCSKTKGELVIGLKIIHYLWILFVFCRMNDGNDNKEINKLNKT